MVPAVAKLVVKKRLKSTRSASATYTPLLRSRPRTAEPPEPVPAVAVIAIGILPLDRALSHESNDLIV